MLYISQQQEKLVITRSRNTKRNPCVGWKLVQAATLEKQTRGGKWIQGVDEKKYKSSWIETSWVSASAKLKQAKFVDGWPAESAFLLI